MSDLGDAELVELLAMKVMGWHSQEYELRGVKYKGCWTNADLTFGAKNTWNPLTNAADSKMIEDALVAKHRIVSILLTPECCTIRLGSEAAPDAVVIVPPDQKMRGLCNAAIQALKGSE